MGVSFSDLKIWQKGVDLSMEVYALTQNFPEAERAGLGSNLRRAAVTVPSHIAEGFGRNCREDFIQFLRMAKGTLCELSTHLVIGFKLSFIDSKDFERMNDLINELHNMILAFIHGCERKLKPEIRDERV